jgi:hypothetical protein
MKRRSVRLLAVSLLLVLLVGLLTAQAADVPVVLQPTDPAFSASERATLLAAARDVERVLQGGCPVSYSGLVSKGWLDRDFVVLTAGILQSAGYEVVVVEGDDGSGGSLLWILVGIPLGERTGWIPVEASPSDGASCHLRGVAWSGNSDTEFEASHLTFDRVVELAPNAAPTARIVSIGMVVVDEQTSFHGRAEDRDGTIIAYVWSIDGEEVEVSTNFVLRYTFTDIKEYEVTLVVFDNRGAQATATKVIEVLAEGNRGCCGAP